jgi:hypothetical protein
LKLEINAVYLAGRVLEREYVSWVSVGGNYLFRSKIYLCDSSATNGRLRSAPTGRNLSLTCIPSIPLRFMLGYYPWLPPGAGTTGSLKSDSACCDPEHHGRPFLQVFSPVFCALRA